MAKQIIYSSLDFLVTQDDGVVSLEQRNRGGVVFGVAALVLGALVWWGRTLLDPSSAYAMVMAFFSCLMVICGTLLLFGAVYFTFRPRGHRFDPHAGIATISRRTYPMQTLTAPYIKSVTVGATRIDTLAMQHLGKEITLLSSSSAGALDPVLGALNQAFAAANAAGTARTTQPIIPLQGSATWRRFLPAFLLLLGTLWAVVGYLTMPDVILGSRRSASGVLLWPLGIWLVALGLFEWVFVWRGKSFFDSQPKVIQIALALWFGSYVLVCLR